MDKSDEELLSEVSKGKVWAVLYPNHSRETFKVRIGTVEKSFKVVDLWTASPAIVCVETGNKYVRLSGLKNSLHTAIRMEFAEDLK